MQPHSVQENHHCGVNFTDYSELGTFRSERGFVSKRVGRADGKNRGACADLRVAQRAEGRALSGTDLRSAEALVACIWYAQRNKLCCAPAECCLLAKEKDVYEGTMSQVNCDYRSNTEGPSASFQFSGSMPTAHAEDLCRSEGTERRVLPRGLPCYVKIRAGPRRVPSLCPKA